MDSLNNPSPSLQIKEGVESQFIDSLTEVVLNRFGTLTKNEYEVLLYHLLTKYGNLKDFTFFTVANILKIPETKVKRLAYEASLVYGNFDRNQIIDDFFQLLSKSIPDVDGKTIKFAIQDKYLSPYRHCCLGKDTSELFDSQSVKIAQKR